MTVNPNDHWSVAGSAAYIDPREHEPLHRLELSALHGDMDPVPEQLRLFYGSRTPVGFIVYLRLRPGPMMEPMNR